MHLDLYLTISIPIPHITVHVLETDQVIFKYSRQKLNVVIFHLLHL